MICISHIYFIGSEILDYLAEKFLAFWPTLWESWLASFWGFSFLVFSVFSLQF